jgi:hypothetical protein
MTDFLTALITLTAITPGIVPSKRVLKLNPECQTIPVGRASKSVSKGLLSAEDNAWFDNPVMSRDHAELILKQEDMASFQIPVFWIVLANCSKSIVIQDVHSMHGTQVNDEKLTPNAPQVVMVGDILSFGAEVRRGPEVFPPCKFRIDYEFTPWTLVSYPYINTLSKEDPVNICLYSRGFQFPDSSDIEDEQDHSEEEAQVEDSQEEDMTPVETPPRKYSTSIDAIDLTSDDAEPPEVSSGPQGLSADEVAADKQAMGCSVAPIVIDADSEEEDEDDSEAENQEMDYVESNEGSDDDSDKENNEESDDSEDEADDVCGNDWENSEILDTESNLDTSQVSDIAPMSARMFHDNKDIPVSSIRTTAGMSTDDSLHDEVHIGKSTDSAAWGDDLSDENEDESSQDEDIEEPSSNGPEMRALPPLGQSFPPFHQNAASMPGSYVWPTIPTPAPNNALISQGLSPIRQPSPSDAAMAKSQTINSGQTINPVQIHHLPGSQFSHFMANTLGDKSGKKDFFEAREINRARVNDEESRHTEYNFTGESVARPKFNQLGHPYNPRPSGPPMQINAGHQQAQYFQRQQLLTQPISRENAFVQPKVFQQHMAFKQQAILQQMAQAQAQAQAQRQAMMAQQNVFKQCSQLTSTAQPSTLATLRQPPSIETDVQSPTFDIRTPSPELDMTSAVKFNESKAAIAAVQPGRSVVRIDDIVEPLAIESDTKSLKRKASDISDVLEEEVRVWASKDSSISAADAISPSNVEMQVENISQQQVSESAEALQPSTPMDSAPAEPAHKRIKKFAEVVGYTALGGLAGGLALFSTLVATAPDFL